MKPNYNYNGEWKFILTVQAKDILAELMDSKENGSAKRIIEDTGMGKTTALKRFISAKGKHSFVVTVGSSFRLLDVLHEIMDLLGINKWESKNSRHRCLRDIKKKLIEIRENGGDPILVIDEAENCRITMLKAWKELYDAINEHCGFVLIGTHQLVEQFYKKSEGQSIPQLNRRFKAGTRFAPPLNKARDFRPFFNEYIPGLADVQDMLLKLCNNYGELRDYLEPALRYCSKKRCDLTIEVMRQIHNLPADIDRYLQQFSKRG